MPASSTTSLDIDLFYVNPGPAWARLTVDGELIARLPVVGRGSPIQLAPGVHQFRWQAAPFSSQSCSISVPTSITDTCMATETTSPPDQRSAWIVSFGASLLTLPTNPRRTLTTAIQQALNQFQASETVYPGERFIDIGVNSGSPINTARQELNATLHLTTDSSTSGSDACTGGDNIGSCKLNGQDCHALCTRASIFPNTWNIVALVQTSWTYTTQDGHVVATNMSDELGGARFLGHFLSLTVKWDGSNWHVQATQEFLNNSGSIPISCVSASDDSLISNTFGTSPWQSFNWRYIAASNPAAGCLLVVTAISSNGSSPTTSSQIIYLHRFGVSLAINRLAQQYDPEMPHPDAYELLLARQVAAQVQVSLG